MATKKPNVQPTIGASTYVDPSQIEWQPSQFKGIQIKVLYVDKEKGEMTCLLKWEPGATLPMHKHPEIEQSFVLEGSFYDHDGICRAGEFVWRQPFPGPGLAVRILGEVTSDRLDLLRQADAIVAEEIKRAGLYRQI